MENQQDRQQLRADQVVAMARRHADEIRAAAEQEADRLLQVAERRAVILQQERLDAHRQELERIAAQRRQIKDCFETAESALKRIDDLKAALSDINPPASSSDSPELPTPPWPSAKPASGDSGSRHGFLNRIGIIGSWGFGVWTVLMLATYAFVSLRLAPVDAVSNVAIRQDAQAEGTQTQAKPASSPMASPARMSMAPASQTNVSAVATSQDLGLTVAFMAARDCWISVASDDGASSERLLKASETHVVRARDVVTFKAGNAAALSVVVNDHALQPLGAEGQVVTRRVTRANYQSVLGS